MPTQLAKLSLFMYYLGDWTAGLRLHDQDGICIVLCASEDRHLVRITSSLTAGLCTEPAWGRRYDRYWIYFGNNSMQLLPWQRINCQSFSPTSSGTHEVTVEKYIISKPGIPSTSSHVWYPWNVVCCLCPKLKTPFQVHTAHCHS